MSYRVEIKTAEQCRDLVPVWDRNLPHDGGFSGKYRWHYLENPHGAAGFGLVHGEETVGAVGLSGRAFLIDGVVQRVGLCSDFAVDPAHRSYLPASLLQRAMVRYGLEEYPLIYGFPNRRAVGVMLRSGFRRLGDFPRYAKIVRVSSYLRGGWRSLPGLAPVADRLNGLLLSAARRRCGRYALTEAGHWDDALERMCRQTDRAGRVQGLRDGRFMAWRVFGEPGGALRLFRFSGEDGGDAGYAVVRSAGDGAWHVQDFCPADGGRVLVALFRYLALEACRHGASSLSVEYLGLPRVQAALGQAGFRRRSSDRCVVVAARPGVLPEDVFPVSRWQVTSIDED